MEQESLPPDFKDFFRFLNEEEVDYLLVGGWAVGVYGASRYTQDIDVWVATGETNARRVVRVLERFGFTHGEANESLVLEPGNIIRLGFPPLRIEIINRLSGVEFDDCIKRRKLVAISGINIPVISLSDLIMNKRASGRPKDLIDLDNLTG
jgi:hypothetical protein